MAEEAKLLIEKLPDLRVVDLKKELEKRKLSKSGSKKELCERLRAQLKIEELRDRSSSTEQAFDSIPSLSLPAADAGAEPNEFVKSYLEQREKLLERQMEQKKKYQEEAYRSQESESQSEAEDLSQHQTRNDDDDDVLQRDKEKSESFKEGVPPSKESKPVPDDLTGDDDNKSDKKSRNKPEYNSETDEDTDKEESNDVRAVDANAGGDGGMSAVVRDDGDDDAYGKNADVVINKNDVSDDNVAHSDNNDAVQIGDAPEVVNVVKQVVKMDNKNEDSNDTDVCDSVALETVATDVSIDKSVDGKECHNKENDEVEMEGTRHDQDETEEDSVYISKTSETKDMSVDVNVNTEAIAVHNERSGQCDDDNSTVETSKVVETNKIVETSKVVETKEFDVVKKKVAVVHEKSADAATNLEKSLIDEKTQPLTMDEPLVVMLSKDDEFDDIKPPGSANDSNPENVDISTMDESEPAPSDIKEIKKPDPEVKVSVRRLFSKHSQKETNSGTTTVAEKPTKKRKWGSVDVAPSLVISSDSLKDLIPEVMLDLSVPNDAMDIIGGDEPDNKLKQQGETKKKQVVTPITPSGTSTSVTTAQPVRLARTIYQEVEVASNSDTVSQTDDSSQVLPTDRNVEMSKERKVIEKKRVVVSAELSEKVRVVKEVDRKAVILENIEESTSSATASKKRKMNPAIQVEVDEPQAAEGPRRDMTPPRNPVSRFIHIFNLVRPYTLPQLKEILSRSGTTVESGFWIDKIKSHCIVEYESTEQAESARMALHGKKWPASNPKILRVDFSSEEELKMMRDSKDGVSTSSVSRKMQPSKIIPDEIIPSGKKIREQQAETLDTKLVSEGQNKRDGKRRDSEREKADVSKTEEHKKQERARPMREWDRNKRASVERDNRRSLSRKRRNSGRVSPRRMPDDRDRKTSRENEPAPKKPCKVEEPPAKLLDDLFRKTKATPCIYWLPLTEEQIAEKEIQVKKIEEERMQRRAEREKRLEEEREERMRARAAGQRPMRGPDEKEGHRRREF